MIEFVIKYDGKNLTISFSIIMANSPELSRYSSHPVSRRTVIVGAVLTPFAVLLGCNREPLPDNNAVISDLQKKLVITPQTTRDEFAQTAATIAVSNPQWMVGTSYEWTTDLNKRIRHILTPQGEFYYDKQRVVYVNYPNPGIGRTQHSTEAISPGDNRHLVVYGTNLTVEKFREKKGIVAEFLAAYGASTQKKVTIHLSFVPNIESVNLLDLHGFGVMPDKNFLRLSAAATVSQIDTKTREIVGFLIILNIPAIHSIAATDSESTHSTMVRLLANEVTSLLIRDAIPTQTRRPQLPKTISSLTGLVARLDKQTAQMILGGTAYEEFVKVVADEMNRIGKVRK